MAIARTEACLVNGGLGTVTPFQVAGEGEYWIQSQANTNALVAGMPLYFVDEDPASTMSTGSRVLSPAGVAHRVHVRSQINFVATSPTNIWVAIWRVTPDDNAPGMGC